MQATDSDSGRMSRLNSLCQEMVEGLGHDFAYHDGYLNSGENKLKSLIQNVDMSSVLPIATATGPVKA